MSEHFRFYTGLSSHVSFCCANFLNTAGETFLSDGRGHNPQKAITSHQWCLPRQCITNPVQAVPDSLPPALSFSSIYKEVRQNNPCKNMSAFVQGAFAL